MTPSLFDELPDSFLTDILSRASSISQQQQQHQTQQDQEQTFAVSTRQQQRHVCGVFTRVSHRWRLQALSICTGLHVSLTDRSAVEQLSSWLQRNGNQLQHLSLDFNGFFLRDPTSFFSSIPTSTPQLQHLKLRGLWRLVGQISADGAAAWGGLTRLTSLDIQNANEHFRAPMQYLDYVKELTVSHAFRNDVATEACMAVQLKLPRLRVLRVQAGRNAQPLDQRNRHALDILSGKQQLQQVDGMTIYDIFLDHAAVGLFYPSLQIVPYNSIGRVDAWLQEGGGMTLVNLELYCHSQPCSRSVLAKLQGLPLLRRLTLSCVGLGAGAPELQQLTQITHLHLVGCSPALTSLAQLPPQLLELTMDSYTAQPQQQTQHQEPTSYLQHLSSLTVTGDTISDAAMRDFSTLPQLQKLCLMKTAAVTSSGGLACLTVLQRLTSLTMERIETAGMQLVASVLSSLTSLRHFAVTFPVPAWAALRLVECLPNAPAIHVAVETWWPKVKTDAVISSGGPQEVRLA